MQTIQAFQDVVLIHDQLELMGQPRAGELVEQLQLHSVFDEPVRLAVDAEVEALLEADGPQDACGVFHKA